MVFPPPEELLQNATVKLWGIKEPSVKKITKHLKSLSYFNDTNTLKKESFNLR